jgi:hypothetical protein
MPRTGGQGGLGVSILYVTTWYRWGWRARLNEIYPEGERSEFRG